ncbi:MAG: DUF3570 domain-containing protein [Burkholderiales bacterium]
MAAIEARLFRRLAALLGGVLAVGGAKAVDLPEDHAEAMFHAYNGGGVKANGPALLVRKSLMDKVSLQGSLYVDSVSNASIDVVTTASPYRETRTEYGLSADYVYRDSHMVLGVTSSKEPDYTANAFSLDVSQESFGGMTTTSLGFTRGSDKVGKHNSPEFSDTAKHWQYRFGVTQILTRQWLASANFEAISDDGYLQSPYRVARVFGAAVPENDPRTRSSRAMKFRVVGDLGHHDAVHGEYRYFWDTWGIKAHTVELGYSRYFGDAILADTFVRYYTQTHALFYSDNAQQEATYVSRNRQLSSYNDIGLGGKLSYTVRKVPGSYELKLNGGLEYVRFKFSDFSDIRTDKLYSYSASVLQLYVSANF